MSQGGATPTVGIRRAAAADDGYSSRVAGDAFDRFVIDVDGRHHWGDGTVPPAVDLYYFSTSLMVLTSGLAGLGDIGAQALTAGRTNFGAVGPAGAAGVTFGAADDAVLYRGGPGVVHTTGQFLADTDIYARLGAGTQVAIGAVGPGGEAGIGFSVFGDRFYRSGAGVIATGSGLALLNGAYAGGTNVGGVISFGTGAPNNANGANGDIYIRVDGGALTTIYQRRIGVWVGIV